MESPYQRLTRIAETFEKSKDINPNGISDLFKKEGLDEIGFRMKVTQRYLDGDNLFIIHHSIDDTETLTIEMFHKGERVGKRIIRK